MNKGQRLYKFILGLLMPFLFLAPLKSVLR